MMSLMTEAARKSDIRQSPRKRTQGSSYASRFVLKEARCNDDEEDSMDEELEDEDTDLSGFIVDDDAELSYHDSSASESEEENKTRLSRPSVVPPRRRLHRGSPTRRRLSFSDDDDAENYKEGTSSDLLADAFRDLGIHEDGSRTGKSSKIEVVDLTSSPSISPKFDLNKRPQPILSQPQIPAIEPANTGSSLSNPFEDFDAILKLAPPVSETTAAPPSKMVRPQYNEDARTDEVEDPLSDDAHDKFKTPPRTPPKSKLNSPSKLLSPSKRQYVPRSPHRPSMDAFWDHNVINDWNDEFSPKKSPVKSPRKGLARFQIYSDSDSDDNNDNNSANISSDSLASPCTPPQKSSSRSQSPLKSPEKEGKKRLMDLKKAVAAKKKDFDARKEKLALDLLHELDSNVAKSQLSKLASSAGGIRIVWSKTLRSTAGRANWRRTASKISGSPIKGGVTDGPGVEIKHFASIELAEKIIDCEDRLVNTLAHEFCHLTNFMISNVRDQPHGASFKSWAAKVTTHLRKSDVEMWRKVEVTTKHNYAINHKYMWVCVGREQTKTMEFLNIDDDDGCGAEYGRHSRSIDTAKHRCGRCKGKLVQVRPKPRAPASPRKQVRTRESSAASSGSGSASSSQSTLGGLVEMVELSD
jgi:predicted SprT family Zn-dependent metalloprotease